MITRHVLPNSTPVQMAGDSKAHRAIIVIQEAFGVNDHIRSLTEGFAARGYFAVSPELFHRTGSPEVPYDNFPEAMTSLSTLSAEGIREDLDATSQFLNDAGFTAASTGIVGYCMGGSITFFAATLGTVGAAASFYGGGVETGRFGLPSLLELASQLRCPWLGLYGDLDKGIPTEQVESLRAAAAASRYPTDIIRYPDADHGFNCDARPAVFNDSASADASRRTLQFFKANLVDK
jgi:carboxymethylenebutenolidase